MGPGRCRRLRGCPFPRRNTRSAFGLVIQSTRVSTDRRGRPARIGSPLPGHRSRPDPSQILARRSQRQPAASRGQPRRERFVIGTTVLKSLAGNVRRCRLDNRPRTSADTRAGASAGTIIPFLPGAEFPLHASSLAQVKSCCQRFRQTRPAATSLPPRCQGTGTPVPCVAWSAPATKSSILDPWPACAASCVTAFLELKTLAAASGSLCPGHRRHSSDES